MRKGKFIDLGILVLIAVHLIYVIAGGPTPPLVLQLALPILYLAAMLRFTKAWMQRSDEVQIHDAKNSLTVGVAAGLAIALLAAVILTSFPGIVAPLTEAAWLTEGRLPPAIAGFAIGVMACITLVSTAYYGAVLYWWLDRRSSR